MIVDSPCNRAYNDCMDYTKGRQYIEVKLSEFERLTLKKQAIDERILVSDLTTKIIRNYLTSLLDKPDNRE